MHADIQKLIFDDAVAWDRQFSQLQMNVFNEHTNKTSVTTVRFHPFHYCSINGQTYKMYVDEKDRNNYTVWFKRQNFTHP